MPAKTTELEPDPLVFLAGGGVAPATMYARFLSRAFTDLRMHRDILLIDQRGTGQSNPTLPVLRELVPIHTSRCPVRNAIIRYWFFSLYSVSLFV